jgi:1-acyl-sn-glycerol-3-phosphate acyltransferase
MMLRHRRRYGVDLAGADGGRHPARPAGRAAAGCEPHLVLSAAAPRSWTTPRWRAWSSRCRHRRAQRPGRLCRPPVAQGPDRLAAGALRPGMTRLVWGLRSALFVLWLAATVVPWALLMLVLSIFVRGTRLYWPTMRWLRMAIWGARVICGVRHRVTGMGNVPTGGRGHEAGAAGLQAPEHLGDLRLPDAHAAPAGLRVQARAALRAVLRLGHGPAGHDPHRPQQARRGLEQGRRRRAGGCWARAAGSSCSPRARGRRAAGKGTYKTGASRLAIATGTPIVPIAVTSARCWPRKSFLLRPGTIDIVIGEPIAVQGRATRRADARGRGLDRGRDAPARSRGLSCASCTSSSSARTVSWPRVSSGRRAARSPSWAKR